MTRAVSADGYIGRYAPSPSGALHVGNAFAAAVACWRAQQQGGHCLLRIEDLDTPRVIAGATASIAADLDWLGLQFDGDTLIQSHHHHRYAAALTSLREKGLLYACACSRKELASAPHIGEEGPAYPGTCRDRALPFDDDKLPVAWRFRLPECAITIKDAWQGSYTQRLSDVGDPVLKRKDGIIAYQLAVVVDDAYQGVTEVVRAVDLLSSAPRQHVLHQALGFEAPTFAHLPMLVDEHGQRISKRDPHHTFSLRHHDAAQLRATFAQGLSRDTVVWPRDHRAMG